MRMQHEVISINELLYSYEGFLGPTKFVCAWSEFLVDYKLKGYYDRNDNK